MSGETGDVLSGWTIDTSREDLLARMDANDRRYAAHFAAQETAMSAALAAAEKAVIKAELAAERRFEAVNEFRGQLSDQAATFMPRGEAMALSSAQAEKLDALASRLDRTEGRTSGVSAGWIILGQGVSLLLGIIAIAAWLAK